MTPKHEVLLFRGDGIGPEIVGAALKVLAATEVPIRWREMPMGYAAMKQTGVMIDETHLKAFEELRVIFKGPLTVPPAENFYVTVRGRTFTSGNQALRKLFQLYANVRPAPRTPGAPTRFPETDLVVIRENTEDLYTGEERWVDADTVEAIKRVTRKASARIAQFAFQYAVENGRRRVTAVHKANVNKQADGLFLEECQKVAAAFPEVQYDEHLADSLLTKLVQDPGEYDLLLCPNLYGDLLSDLAGGLTGGLGLLGSANIGEGYALFEPSHGSAPDIAGRGIANPTSQIRCAIMLLHYLQEHEAARGVESALSRVIQERRSLTPDLGGTAGTEEMAAAVAAEVARGRSD